MKRIIEECNHYFEYNPETQSASIDGVKLRLRGRGSGFLEGPEQKESNEHLIFVSVPRTRTSISTHASKLTSCYRRSTSISGSLTNKKTSKTTIVVVISK